jgi:uncharacterized protein
LHLILVFDTIKTYAIRTRQEFEPGKQETLKMKLQSCLLAAALFAAGPALAQSATDSSQPKPAPQHQPGTLAKPADSDSSAPAKTPSAAPAKPPAEKLDPAKEAAIRHLMDITETSKMGDNLQNYITQRVQEAVSHAIAPDRVQKFMDTFSQKFNASASPSAVTDAVVPLYAKNFSMEDIQGLIQFYESPLGKRVVKTLPEISQESQKLGLEMDQDAALVVLRGMSNEYTEIKPMLPPEEGKSSGDAPAAAPAAAPAPKPAAKPAPATGTAPAPKPAPQN